MKISTVYKEISTFIRNGIPYKITKVAWKFAMKWQKKVPKNIWELSVEWNTFSKTPLTQSVFTTILPYI